MNYWISKRDVRLQLQKEIKMSTIESYYVACETAAQERKASGRVRHVNAIIYDVRDDETREVIGHRIGGYWISDFQDASTVKSF